MSGKQQYKFQLGKMQTGEKQLETQICSRNKLCWGDLGMIAASWLEVVFLKLQKWAMRRKAPSYMWEGRACGILPWVLCTALLDRQRHAGGDSIATEPPRCCCPAWARLDPGASRGLPAGSAETISPAEVRVAHPQDSSPGFGKIGLFTRFISSPSAH